MRRQRRKTQSALTLAPQAAHVTRVINQSNYLSNRTKFCGAEHPEQRFVFYNASSLSEYPKHPTALNATSKRVRIPRRVNDHPVVDLTIDSASDIPCVAVDFLRQHPTLKNTEMLAVPPKAINLRSADGSQLEILGYICFNLTLGDITLPVEALVLRNLGPDKMLLDNSKMGAFGASSNWNTEELSFANSRIKMKATHRINHSTHPTHVAQCSVVALVDNKVESVPVYLTKKCCVPPQHEMAVHVETINAQSMRLPKQPQR